MGFKDFSTPYDWSRVGRYKRIAQAVPGGMVDLSVGSPVDAVPCARRSPSARTTQTPVATR